MEMNGVEEDTTTRDINLTNSDTVTSLPEFVWTEVQYNTTSTTTKVRVHNNNNK